MELSKICLQVLNSLNIMRVKTMRVLWPLVLIRVVRLPIGGRLRAYVSALKKFVQKTRSLHSQPADLATVLTQTVF